ncbi:tyrosine-type recombinase/integrase [Fictibacillus terranigra]|uniref:Phage integrase N-terminal SAM-like domain-containing protein n=1 Tax=Fictibacillus terranigra TaxID=3058424 RepID=A0ABT8E621_9BACL|nr:phage integrase N-terminal SAM-like domain-containing protein [Fictibacillus sp. CENA-BCM004]MDN4073353.1 phage integrase N-terminal SAM-like domain-containing protein [Fictibacillus sp. CENA-BCM004]
MYPLIDSLPRYSAVYLETLEKKGRQESTIRRYFYDLNDFLAWMRAVKKEDSFSAFQSLRTEDYQSYFDFLIRERNYSLRTLRRVLTVLKQLVQFQITLGKLAYNPVNGVDLGIGEETAFSEEDFISPVELERLNEIIKSYEGLTENQQKYRYLLISRNFSIVVLLSRYGLSLLEVTSLKMKHINFTKGIIQVPSETSLSRKIKLEKEDQAVLYSYYQTIPAAVRPAWYSNDCFFAAFDYQRGTYRWVYKTNSPKPLTEIAVQKMIRMEVERSGLRKGISAQHMRRTCILNEIQTGKEPEQIKKKFGFKSSLSLERYYKYLQSLPKEREKNLAE